MSCGPACAGRAFPRQSPALTPGQRRRLDPLTLTLLRSHAEMLSRERAEFGSGHADSGPLFCWEDGRPVHRTPSPAGSARSWSQLACRRSICTACATAMRVPVGTRRSTGRRSASESGIQTWPSRCGSRCRPIWRCTARSPPPSPSSSSAGSCPGRAPWRHEGMASMQAEPRRSRRNRSLVHKSVHTGEQTSPGAAAPRL